MPKSIVLLSTLGGVPVFKRSVSNPRDCSFSVRPTLGASPALPAGADCLPTQILPFIKVPVVMTTASARRVIPKCVTTP